MPRRVVDRLGEAAARELIEARHADARLLDLVERYGVSESSVKRMLKAEEREQRLYVVRHGSDTNHGNEMLVTKAE